MGPGLRRDDEDSHWLSSLNLLATRSVRALMAASASGPVAETTIEVPGPADSIISPMMEVPPTVSLPFVTHPSALKRSTIWTNFAEARACRPRLLMMGISRTTAAPAEDGVSDAASSPGEAESSGVAVIFRREPGWRW